MPPRGREPSPLPVRPQQTELISSPAAESGHLQISMEEKRIAWLWWLGKRGAEASRQLTGKRPTTGLGTSEGLISTNASRRYRR